MKTSIKIPLESLPNTRDLGGMERYYTDVMHLSREDLNTLKDLYLV